jgi:hypothetical protein
MHVIEQQIVAVGNRVRRLLLVHAGCWIVAIVLATIVLLVAADYLLRFEDRGVRAMALMAVVGVTIWAVARFLLPVWRFRPSSVEIARHVEHRFPGLSDRLASTVEFLQATEDDPTAGSPRLRRAIILETESDAGEVDWRSVIDARATRIALAVAGVAVAAVAAIAAIVPTEAGIGLARLFNPLSNAVWPHVHELAFKNPVTRLALGQPFEVEVIDRHGTPPDDVRIQYRYPATTGGAASDEEKVPSVNGALLARKDQVIRPFEYRAVGGDDHSMEWVSLEVVEPPRLESLEITLHPPAYTGFSAQTLGGGSRRIEALVGTQVELSGNVTKPLVSAVLKQEHGASVPATVNADGESFAIRSSSTPPMMVETSGHYWLELTDRENLTGGTDDRWEIRALVDPPPTVTLERPAANIFVTAEATVPIKAVVKDNLAIRRIGLSYTRSDQPQESEQVVEFFHGPEKAESLPGETMTSEPGQARTVDERWDLAPLKLSPCTQVFIHIDADDYQPKTGSSAVRKLSIVTAAEMEERLAARETTIMAEVARSLKTQQEVRAVTRAVEQQLSDVGSLRKQDADQLQGAEMNQRQLRRSLASSSEGVAGQIAGLQAELENNRLESPEIRNRLTQIAGEISRLDRGPLAEIEQQMTTAVKNLEANPDLKSALSSAGRRQDEVVGALEKLLADLGQWNNLRSLARDIGQIRRDQAELEKQTRAVGADTLTRDSKDLSSQQTADLKKVAGEQEEIAKRFEKVLGHMEQLSNQNADTSPADNPTVADALQSARDLGLTGQMRESSRSIEKNRVGQALEHQSTIERGLDELLDIMANRQESDLRGLVKKLREAEDKLADLRHQQAGLQKQLQALTEQLNQAGADQESIKRQLERLSRQEKQIQRDTQRLARQLQRLQADRAAKAATQAGGESGQAAAAVEQGDAEKADEEAQAAERDLDDAQRQVAETRRQAERDLAQEQLAKVSEEIKSLAERQSHVVDETAANDLHRHSPEGLSKAQSQSVRDLARTQSDLGSETTQTAEKIAEAEVFHLALQEAADDMATAATLLAKLDTGTETQQAASRALERLQQIIAALASDKDAAADKPDSDKPGGADAASDQQGEEIANLSEIKLLKMMQDQLNQRTRELDKSAGKQPTLTAAQQREYTELAKQQGRLAELLNKKLARPQGNPEDHPESLPDLRQKDDEQK